MILINKYPYEVSARQISDIINSYEWGFRTPITSRTISKLLQMELKKHDKHFLSNVYHKRVKNLNTYSIYPIE